MLKTYPILICNGFFLLFLFSVSHRSYFQSRLLLGTHILFQVLYGVFCFSLFYICVWVLSFVARNTVMPSLENMPRRRVIPLSPCPSFMHAPFIENERTHARTQGCTPMLCVRSKAASSEALPSIASQPLRIYT